MKNRLYDAISRFAAAEGIRSIIRNIILMGVFLYYIWAKAPMEVFVTMVLCYAAFAFESSLRKIRIVDTIDHKMYFNTQRTMRKYFYRLVYFLRASDILNDMDIDAVHYDPDFVAEDGKNGYPADSPGVYINLCAGENEACVVRAEYDTNKDRDLRIVAYQNGVDEAVLNTLYNPVDDFEDGGNDEVPQ